MFIEDVLLLTESHPGTKNRTAQALFRSTRSGVPPCFPLPTLSRSLILRLGPALLRGEMEWDNIEISVLNRALTLSYPPTRSLLYLQPSSPGKKKKNLLSFVKWMCWQSSSLRQEIVFSLRAGAGPAHCSPGGPESNDSHQGANRVHLCSPGNVSM